MVRGRLRGLRGFRGQARPDRKIAGCFEAFIAGPEDVEDGHAADLFVKDSRPL